MQHVYADYKKSPYGQKYPGELILVAKRACAFVSPLSFRLP